jgi:hypothetical protein
MAHIVALFCARLALICDRLRHGLIEVGFSVKSANLVRLQVYD